ncbi:MAG: MFS transporter [Desulfuromonadales bacterium]|nr:MFS transporter [Desulfuromonadales bacterium]
MTAQGTKFYGWILVGTFFGIYFVNATFPYYGASVLNAYMVEALGLDRSALGLGFSAFSLSVGLASPVVAYCISKKGVRFTLSCGGLIIALGSLLMALLVTTTWHYVLVFGVIVGTGVSVGGVIPIQTGVTLWFRRRKALAMSIVLSATGIGALVATPLLNKVVSAFDGNWRAGWFLVMAAALLAVVLAAAGVRNSPAELGQVPDGRPADADPATASSRKVAANGRVFQSDENWQVRQAVRTRTFWLIIIAAIAYLGPFNACVAHGVIYLKDLGHSRDLAALSLGLLVVSSLIGRLLAGALGDRLEPRIVWSVAQISILAGTIALIHATGSALVYLYAVLVGAGMGSAFVCMPTILGNYFGPQSFAPIMGIVFPVSMIVGGLAPLAAGIVYDHQGSYATAFYGLAALAFLGGVLVMQAKPPVPAFVPQPSVA